jgi:hypothetical protein
MSESEFVSQLAGSASANALFAVLFLVGICIKRLCDRPSKCHAALNCCCLSLSVDDDDEECPERDDEKGINL